MVNHKLATLAYIIHDSEVLLLFRNKKIDDFHEGKFIGIGGRLEPGETPLECIEREIREESGYILKPEEIKFRGYIYFDEINRDIINEDIPAFNWLVFLYSAYVSEKIKHINPEGELKWFEINKIPYELMWTGDKFFTPKILNTDEIIEGKFLYEDEQIKKWNFGRSGWFY